jgi:NAD(P)-binding Rossmann-like domain
MRRADFVIVGSGGGGGTIAWLLAKTGYQVTVLEQGPDWTEAVERDSRVFNPVAHDEELYRLRHTDPKRRLRGSYVTFREGGGSSPAAPFDGGWTGTHLGGGSVIWGIWGLRPFPVGVMYAHMMQLKGFSPVPLPASNREPVAPRTPRQRSSARAERRCLPRSGADETAAVCDGRERLLTVSCRFHGS